MSEPTLPAYPWPVAAERVYGAFADAIGLKPQRDAAQALQQLLVAQIGELTANAGMLQVLGTAWMESLMALPARLNEGRDALESPLALLRLWSAELDQRLHAAMLSDQGLAATAATVRATARRRLETQRLADHAREALGSPGREEVDDAHREIQALKREMRELKRQLEAQHREPRS